MGTEEDTFNALRRIPAQQAVDRYFAWRGYNLPGPSDEEKDSFMAALGWTWSELHVALQKNRDQPEDTF